MDIQATVYEKYYPILEKFLKCCPYGEDKKEYQSFVQFKFCQIVERYYRRSLKGLIDSSPEKYVHSALSKAVNCRFYKKKDKHIFVDPGDFENQVCILEGSDNNKLIKQLKQEGNVMDNFMLMPIWAEKVGTIDLESPLLDGMTYREICFVLLNLCDATQDRIAFDFKLSIKTVQRVIKEGKKKLYKNAFRLGYLSREVVIL